MITQVSKEAEASKRTRGLKIAHLTNLDGADEAPFAHALTLGRASASSVVSVHANDAPAALTRMPRAIELFVRWGLVPADAGAGAEQKLGIEHSCMVDNCCDEVVDTLLSVLERVKPDLVVMATGARDTARRLLVGSVAEALAPQVSAPTLLLPVGCRPFVSLDRGTLTLERILVAAGDEQAVRVGTAHALWLADLAGAAELEVELLHVGDGERPAAPPTAQRANTRIRVNQVAGALEPQIAARATAWPADLIVMATRGHDSVRDVLFGSHAERTLHLAPCPVLLVPLPEEK